MQWSSDQWGQLTTRELVLDLPDTIIWQHQHNDVARYPLKHRISCLIIVAHWTLNKRQWKESIHPRRKQVCSILKNCPLPLIDNFLLKNFLDQSWSEILPEYYLEKLPVPLLIQCTSPCNDFMDPSHFAECFSPLSEVHLGAVVLGLGDSMSQSILDQIDLLIKMIQLIWTTEQRFLAHPLIKESIKDAVMHYIQNLTCQEVPQFQSHWKLLSLFPLASLWVCVLYNPVDCQTFYIDYDMT